MMTWKSRVKRDSRECTIKIPADQIKIIHDSLATYGTIESSSIWHFVDNIGRELL
jgi:hypothetical protein